MNLIGADKPQDIYQRVADRVNELLIRDPGSKNPSPQDHIYREYYKGNIKGTEDNCSDLEVPENETDRVILLPRPLIESFYEDATEVDKDALDMDVAVTYDDTYMSSGWLLFGIDRKITKRPVMVLPYGGTFRSCMDYVRAAVREQIAGGKENPFGEDLAKAEVWLAKVVWRAIDEIVIGAREVMGFLQDWSRVVERMVIRWTTASSFVVYQV